MRKQPLQTRSGDVPSNHEIPSHSIEMLVTSRA